MTGREHLDALGPILEPARNLRYLKPEDFDDCTVAELETAARALHAISYSALTGARLLESVAARRRGTEVDMATEQ